MINCGAHYSAQCAAQHPMLWSKIYSIQHILCTVHNLHYAVQHRSTELTAVQGTLCNVPFFDPNEQNVSVQTIAWVSHIVHNQCNGLLHWFATVVPLLPVPIIVPTVVPEATEPRGCLAHICPMSSSLSSPCSAAHCLLLCIAKKKCIFFASAHF